MDNLCLKVICDMPKNLVLSICLNGFRKIISKHYLLMAHLLTFLSYFSAEMDYTKSHQQYLTIGECGFVHLLEIMCFASKIL